VLSSVILVALGAAPQGDDAPQTMTGVMSDNGKPVGRVYVKGTVSRSEVGDLVMISDQKTGEFLELVPSRHSGIHAVLKGKQGMSLRGMLATVKSAATQPIGQKQIDGRLLSGFTGAYVDGPDRHYIRAWIDPATKLYVRLEDFGDTTQPADSAPETTLDNLQFNVPLDDALFSTKPPAGYQVTEAPAAATQP
jgi:hypothetical protein